MRTTLSYLSFFFFNAPATPEIYTLSLHDALPISAAPDAPARDEGTGRTAGRSAARGLHQPGRSPPPEGLHGDRALPHRRGAEGLQVAGRRDPRQAHRADRSPDVEEGARRERGRDRSAAG